MLFLYQGVGGNGSVHAVVSGHAAMLVNVSHTSPMVLEDDRDAACPVRVPANVAGAGEMAMIKENAL